MLAERQPSLHFQGDHCAREDDRQQIGGAFSSPVGDQEYDDLILLLVAHRAVYEFIIES